MRKRLDTRFPAARIKKIMQADEDVGKIALAVPLLVSKALELFLQDLCDRTYEITLKKGAKTMNSFHLKHCIQSFNVFDFLKDVVSRVPDLGGSDAGAESATKRRKVAEEDDHYSDDDIKRNHMNETANNSGTGRGRGRGRRGRGRGARAAEKGDSNVHSEKLEDPSADVSHQKDDEKPKQNDERMVDHVAEPAADSKNILAAKHPSEVVAPARNFDLNIDLNECVESTPIPSEAPSSSTAAAAAPSEVKHEEIPGWSLSEMEKMAIDPIQLANLNRGLDEEEEDYDEEG